MSNFTFIKADFPTLHEDAVKAARFAFDASAIFCHNRLEHSREIFAHSGSEPLDA